MLFFLFLLSFSRGMVLVLVKLWLLQGLSFLIQLHLRNFPLFVWSADRDHTQRRGLSAPVGASSVPPQRFLTPLKHKRTSQQLQLQDGTDSLSKYGKFTTFDLGIRPTLKKPIWPVSIFVQSTTVDAMFSGEAPSHNTPST